MLPAHELTGEGPPLVLIPGTLSDRRSWGKQVGALSARHRCLLFDPRGTGASADPGRPFGPDDLVADLIELMDAAGLARAHLVGHSLGAHCALLLAARHPDRVGRVVAAAPTSHMDGYLLAVMDLWEALTNSGLPDHEVHQGLLLNAFGREAFERLVPAVVRELDQRPIPRATILRYVACDRLMELRPHLGRVDAAVLVIAGADDALAGVEQPRAIAAAITGARFELIERSGHSPHLERASNFNKLVAEFLAH